MPHSYNFYKEDIKEWIIKNVPRHKRILDVGPGVGTYSTMLRTTDIEWTLWKSLHSYKKV